MPSVLIVDENLLIRLGLQKMLGEEYRGLTFGEAASGHEAIVRLIGQSWDLVVVGLNIHNKNGSSVLQEIRSHYPTTRVLVLSAQPDLQYSLRVQEWGATGCVGKNARRADLLKAFKNVFAGKKHFENQPSQATGVTVATKPHGLSAREYRVMLGYAAGKHPSQMAADLGLSIKTISTYRRRILDKLGLQSNADLVRYAINKRLL